MININNLSDAMFLPVMQYRDIARAKILPFKDRKPGGKDIVIKDLFGTERTMTRQDFMATYRYSNGKPIKLSYWKNDKQIVVLGNTQRMYYGLLIPKGKKAIVTQDGNTQQINTMKSNVYLLCNATEDGIDRSRYMVIPERTFKSAFSMSGSLQENIKTDNRLLRIINNRKEKLRKLQEQRQAEELQRKQMQMQARQRQLEQQQLKARLEAEQKAAQAQAKQRQLEQQRLMAQLEAEQKAAQAEQAEQARAEQAARAKEAQQTAQQTAQQAAQQTAQQTAQQAKFKAVAKLLFNDEVVGYALQDNQNNVYKVSKSDVLCLADAGSISNMSVRRLQTGQTYLYGLGIRLAELPDILM